MKLDMDDANILPKEQYRTTDISVRQEAVTENGEHPGGYNGRHHPDRYYDYLDGEVEPGKPIKKFYLFCFRLMLALSCPKLQCEFRCPYTNRVFLFRPMIYHLLAMPMVVGNLFMIGHRYNLVQSNDPYQSYMNCNGLYYYSHSRLVQIVLILAHLYSLINISMYYGVVSQQFHHEQQQSKWLYSYINHQEEIRNLLKTNNNSTTSNNKGIRQYAASLFANVKRLLTGSTSQPPELNGNGARDRASDDRRDFNLFKMPLCQMRVINRLKWLSVVLVVNNVFIIFAGSIIMTYNKLSWLSPSVTSSNGRLLNSISPPIICYLYNGFSAFILAQSSWNLFKCALVTSCFQAQLESIISQYDLNHRSIERWALPTSDPRFIVANYYGQPLWKRRWHEDMYTDHHADNTNHLQMIDSQTAQPEVPYAYTRCDEVMLTRYYPARNNWNQERDFCPRWSVASDCLRLLLLKERDILLRIHKTVQCLTEANSNWRLFFTAEVCFRLSMVVLHLSTFYVTVFDPLLTLSGICLGILHLNAIILYFWNVCRVSDQFGKINVQLLSASASDLNRTYWKHQKMVNATMGIIDGIGFKLVLDFTMRRSSCLTIIGWLASLILFIYNYLDGNIYIVYLTNPIGVTPENLGYNAVVPTTDPCKAFG